MKVYPVIHVRTVEQVRSQVANLVRHPVDGVFLIDHDADDRRLADCVAAVRDQHPDLFLGANVIRRDLPRALAVLRDALGDVNALDALWCDDAGCNRAGSVHPETVAETRAAVTAIARERDRSGWRGVYFGGIAFKYQVHVPYEHLPAVAALAREFVDVPTTSGPATGHPADLDRLGALRVGLGPHPLALASGVTPDNVGDYVGIVEHVLVATGIGDGNGGVDEVKLTRLLRAVGSR